MKIVRVWMLLVFVMGVMLGGCETGESPRVNDVAPPSGVAVVKPPAPSSETAVRKPSAHPSPKASMDRLMVEMEGGAPLPKESRVAVRHPEDRPPPRAPASGSTGTCPPAWYEEDRENSSDFHYGFGKAAENDQSSAEQDAQQNAKLDVAKAIESHLFSEFTSQAEETTGEKFRYSVKSNIKESVDLSLTGLSITKSDLCDNEWYAKAKLNVAQTLKAWDERFLNRVKEAEHLSGQVSEYKKGNAAFERARKQYALAVTLEEASKIQQRLQYLATDKLKDDLSLQYAKHDLQHPEDDYKTLFDSVKVEIFSGDKQQAVKKDKLPEPLVVWVRTGEDPVAGVRVEFTLPKESEKTIRVSPRLATTNKDGKAKVDVSYDKTPNEKDKDVQIEATVRLDEKINNYPEDFKKLFKGKQKTFTVIFQVKPPVFRLRKEALEMVGKAKKLKSEIEGRETEGNVLGVMEAMVELYKVQNKGKPVVERLIDLHSASRKDVGALGAPKETRDALESVLRSFKVQIASGNNQQAVEPAALPEPFVVQVLAGTDPVAGVPVAFTVQKGTITLSSSRKITDKDGKVEAEGRYPTPLENDDAARIEAKVSLDEITKNYPDALKQVVEPNQKRLAVDFHVKPPVFHLLDEALEMVDKAKGLKFEIQAHETKRDVLGVMKAMVELYKVQNKGKPVVERLVRLHSDSREDVKALHAPEETLSKLKRLVSSFRFTDVKGADQQAVFNSQLNEALSAKLEAKLKEEYVPAQDVPVRFEVKRGEEGIADVEHDDPLKTDGAGYVHASVKRVEPGNLKHRHISIFAKVDSRKLGFITDLEENNRHFEATQKFTITRPHACKSGNSFRALVYELACDLAKQVNQSKGKPTVVRDFVMIKNTSRDCHPLSNHIEEALKVGLKLTKQVKVQEPPSGAEVTQKCGATLTKQVKVQEPSTSENALTPRAPEVEVSGLYQIRGKNLWVNATLNRLTKDGKKDDLEAESGKSIPLDDLPEKVHVPSSDDDLPVVPDPSGFATHDEWVETFWIHPKPLAAFSTEIQPKKEYYNDKENPRFSFRTKKKCYLWVFSIGKTGNVYMLIPNYHNKKPRLVHEGEKVRIPDPTKDLKLKLTIKPPFGTERVKTICTEHHIDIVAPHHVDELTNKDNPVLKFSRENGRFRLVGGASLTGVTLDPGEWSEAHTTVITLPEGQTMTRGMRGLRDLGLVSTEE